VKTYYIDTNIILRLLLEDNKKQAKIAKNYFKNAKKKLIKIVVISEIIFEINFVLQKVYSITKQEREKYLSALIKTPYLEIENRQILLEMLKIYNQVNIDLVDIFLYLKAQEQNGIVLSFDKDIKQLQRKFNSNF